MYFSKNVPAWCMLVFKNLKAFHPNTWPITKLVGPLHFSQLQSLIWHFFDRYYKCGGLEWGLSTSYLSQHFSAEYGHKPPDAVKVTWKDHNTFGVERKFTKPTDQSLWGQFMVVLILKISTFYISGGNKHHGCGDWNLFFDTSPLQSIPCKRIFNKGIKFRLA